MEIFTTTGKRAMFDKSIDYENDTFAPQLKATFLKLEKMSDFFNKWNWRVVKKSIGLFCAKFLTNRPA